MSVPDHSRFDELLSRYLDAALGDAEEHELLQHLGDETLAARFHEATQLDTEIAGILAGSIPDDVMVGLVWSDLAQGESSAAKEAPQQATTPARRKHGAINLLALAAALVGLLVISAAYFLRSSAPVAVHSAVPQVRGQFSSIKGEVYFVGPSGQIALTADQPITGGGTIKTIGPDSRATLTLADGTQIDLKGDASLSANFDSGNRRLVLNQGLLHATVAKQPPNSPLIFGTPHAIATVRGTELALAEEKGGTYLIVMEGSVGLQYAAEAPELLVNAGFYSHVEEPATLHAFPIARLPRGIWDQVFIKK